MTSANLDAHARHLAVSIIDAALDGGLNGRYEAIDHAAARIRSLVEQAVREARDEDARRDGR